MITTTLCTLAAVSSIGLANVTVDSAGVVSATGGNPEYCVVRGSVTTSGNGAAEGSAGFELKLPSNWNGKFLLLGVGAFAGGLTPEVNRLDLSQSLVKGYATIITDGGHRAPLLDGSWALDAPGDPNRPALVDYYYRAVHDVTTAAKSLVEAYFDAPIQYSYADGCSNGGRMGLMEASRFPDDYDGIIAGAPFIDTRVAIQNAKVMKQMLTPATYIPAAKVAAIDHAIAANCDTADGIADGLIQDPRRCTFDPDSLVPLTLTQGQADTLKAYFGATRDRRGRVVYPGFSMSDLFGTFPFELGMNLWTTGLVPPSDFTANEPWGNAGPPFFPFNWRLADHFLKFIVARDPGYDVRDFDVTTDGVVGDQALARFDQRTRAGNVAAASGLIPYLARRKRVLLYHGFSDPALPPARTIDYYNELADLLGGYETAQQHVRLFMVPGMRHCGGGPGPNVFDTLTALENWVEHGTAPDALAATHFTNNNPALGVDRTMPLCPFPQRATYIGTGDLRNGANWSCTSDK